MSTTVIQGAAIAAESSFGSLDADGHPSTAGLSFYGLRFERGSYSLIGGTQETIPDAVARTGPFPVAPEPIAPWDGGVRVWRQTGDIAINMEVRGFGGGDGVMSDANDLPLIIMLNSCMHLVDTGGARLTPTGAGANAGEVTFTTGTGPALGEIVLAEVDGCIVANRVTKVDTGSPDDTVTFAHYWPRSLTTSDRVQRGMNLSIRQGSTYGVVGPSFAMRMQSLDGEAVAYGCRLRSATFTATSGKLMVALVVKAGIIVPGAINPGNVTPTSAPPLLSPPCILRRAALRVSDASGEDVALLPAPVSTGPGEVPYELDTFNLALTWTLTDIGTGCGDLGIANTEPSTAAVTLAYTSREVSAAHQEDVLQRVSRNIGIAAAPIQNTVAGSPNYLNGWGAFIPCASLTAAVNVDVSGEVTAQACAWQASEYLRGDDFGGTPTAVNQFVLYLGGT